MTSPLRPHLVQCSSHKIATQPETIRLSGCLPFDARSLGNLIALAGLVVNAVWKVSWADPVATLALLPLIVRKGWEARKGKPCCN
jgi:hypothetical protein